MMSLDVLFFGFGAMVVIPLIYMIFTRNIIRAVFAFTISLLGLAAIYVLLNADLMAVVQILIYAGGIVVLLIFGVMLTKRTSEAGVYTDHHQVVIGSFVFIGMLVFLVTGILQAGQVKSAGVEVENQIAQVGVLYLTDHLVAFELVAFLLLVALVGAAFLAKKSDH
ncbi:MAG: NADH-quinone oxidoreductase subunit J [Cyclobacteriaceae bacterium]